MVTIVEYLFSNGCCFGHRKKAAMTPKLQPLLPNHNRESTLTFKFKGSNILSVENLASLGRILKGLFQTKERPLILNRIHEIHFVCDILFDRLLPASDSKQLLQKNFPQSSMP